MSNTFSYITGLPSSGGAVGYLMSPNAPHNQTARRASQNSKKSKLQSKPNDVNPILAIILVVLLLTFAVITVIFAINLNCDSNSMTVLSPLRGYCP